MKLILLCFLYLFVSCCFTQNEYLISGKVIDRNTGLPIENSNVTVLDYNLGTITSETGIFKLTINELPQIIKISHVSYEDKHIQVSEMPLYDIIIKLDKKTVALEEVVISDKKIISVFKDKYYSVLDYEFYENGIILLVFRNKISEPELILLSSINDTLIIQSELPEKSQSIYKDCMGYMHLLGKELTHQIFVDDKKIEFLYPTLTSEFAGLIYPCVVFLNNKYYIRLFQFNNLITEYQYIEEGTAEMFLLRRIMDMVKVDLMYSNPFHATLLGAEYLDRLENNILNSTGDIPAELQAKRINALRGLQFEAHYLNNIIYTPVYAPLIELNDSLIIFNHPENQIEFYSNNDSLVRIVPVSYHLKKGWEEQIIVDKDLHNVYALFKSSAIFELRKIDLHSGKPGKSNKLYYPFPQKIKVRNGFVYYIINDHSSGGKTKLFKQQLNF